MEESREYLIERLPGWGKLEELKKLLEPEHTQEEIDIALGNAIAYSQIEVAKFLISLGASMAHWSYDGVYYAVHNNELEGLRYAIEQGVDVNINRGQLLNTAIITAYNTEDLKVLKFLLANGADINLLTDETMNAFGTKEIIETIKNATQHPI